ncbi:DUF1073 domain-containing protein [candidate division KSB1 bacterium]|nr:DUF1073 domain-containing protein [candidate division KSB1 bacterium]
MSTLAKARDSLVNLVANLGTSKDKRSHTQFQQRKFEREGLSTIYREDWLAGKIVDIPVDDMTRKWRSFSSPSLSPEQLDDLKQAEKDLKIKALFNETEKWARLYGGAGIIIGVDGAGEMNEPLELESIREGSLKYLISVDRWDLIPCEVNTTDPSKPDFRIPQSYTLYGGKTRIHHTRVLHFDGLILPWRERQKENYWGQSIVQRVYDAVVNASSTAQSVNSLVYESKIDVVSVKNLFRQLSSKGGESAIIERFINGDAIKSINNMLLIDSDEESYEQKQLTFAGLSDLMLRFLNIAAAAADIPATRLLGESAPGLNATGTEQTRQYYDMVNSNQVSKFGPQLDYLDQIWVRSTIGAIPDDWSFEFNSLWQTTDTEQADIDLKNSQRDKNHMEMGNVTSSMVATDLKEKGTYQIPDEWIETLEAIEKDELEGEVEPEPIEPVEVPEVEPEPAPVAEPNPEDETEENPEDDDQE